MKQISILSLFIFLALFIACQKEENSVAVDQLEPSSINNDFNQNLITEFRTFLTNETNFLGYQGLNNLKYDCALIENYPEGIIKISIPNLDEDSEVNNIVIGIRLQNQKWKYKIINKKYYQEMIDYTSFSMNKWIYESYLMSIKDLQDKIDNGCNRIETSNRCDDIVCCSNNNQIIINCETNAIQVTTSICNDSDCSGSGGSGNGDGSGDGTGGTWDPDNWNDNEEGGINNPPNNDEGSNGGSSNDNSSFCNSNNLQITNFDALEDLLADFIENNNIENTFPLELMNIVRADCLNSSNFDLCMAQSLLCALGNAISGIGGVNLPVEVNDILIQNPQFTILLLDFLSENPQLSQHVSIEIINAFTAIYPTFTGDSDDLLLHLENWYNNEVCQDAVSDFNEDYNYNLNYHEEYAISTSNPSCNNDFEDFAFDALAIYYSQNINDEPGEFSYPTGVTGLCWQTLDITSIAEGRYTKIAPFQAEFYNEASNSFIDISYPSLCLQGTAFNFFGQEMDNDEIKIAFSESIESARRGIFSQLNAGLVPPQAIVRIQFQAALCFNLNLYFHGNVSINTTAAGCVGVPPSQVLWNCN